MACRRLYQNAREREGAWHGRSHAVVPVLCSNDSSKIRPPRWFYMPIAPVEEESEIPAGGEVPPGGARQLHPGRGWPAVFMKPRLLPQYGACPLSPQAMVASLCRTTYVVVSRRQRWWWCSSGTIALCRALPAALASKNATQVSNGHAFRR